ncbi:DUF6587 family protein [Noviluteimonas gilva]|uniref:Transmembrane protein n=1 Tax=Noviluteimonas gilva TaxID=2682097 RepID=A0A7C9M3W1_9GAMM|nr:DUF6587 family protein [Lysobacter gilvus]MUV14342.1 hypothetical protein [Lysobacter gilvus]
MHAGIVAQYVVVGVVVVASGAFVLNSRWPAGVRKLRIACAVPLVRETRPQWMRKLGVWIAPAVRNAAACGDGGCDGCSSH